MRYDGADMSCGGIAFLVVEESDPRRDVVPTAMSERSTTCGLRKLPLDGRSGDATIVTGLPTPVCQIPFS